MRIELPDGQWADIASAEEITEGMFRVIDRAADKRIHVGAVLRERGYADSAEWGKGLTPEEIAAHPQNLVNTSALTALSDEEDAAVRDYPLVVMGALIREWSFDAVVSPDSLLALKKATFDTLDEACQAQVKSTTLDTEVSPDPKVTTDSSSG